PQGRGQSARHARLRRRPVAADDRARSTPVNSESPVIVAEQASKLFLDGTVVAFRQLSLQVLKNEILCVVGPSGCGKTTLLRCIAGLTELSGGTLAVHGKP